MSIGHPSGYREDSLPIVPVPIIPDLRADSRVNKGLTGGTGKRTDVSLPMKRHEDVPGRERIAFRRSVDNASEMCDILLGSMQRPSNKRRDRRVAERLKWKPGS